MKFFSGKNKTVFIALIFAAFLYAGEIIIDKIYGDGDGIITNYNIHKIIFTILYILACYLFLYFINKLYVTFFKNKISGNAILLRAGKIFFILLVVIGCFLILEISSRYFFPAEGTFDRMYPVENARKPFPYVMFKGNANAPTGLSNELYNEHGYRGAYPKMPKNTNEFRIIILGGSTVWEGMPSIPKLLEEKFHSMQQPDIRVYNFGVVSSVSSMELSCIVNEIINLSPDLVIMYNGANDMTNPFKYDPRPGYPFNFLVYENNPFLMKNYPALSLLAYKSNLIRLLARKYFTEEFSKISKLKKRAGYGSDKWRNETADVYINNLKKASTICAAYHSRFYVFLQPMVYFKKKFSTEEQQFTNAHNEDLEYHLLIRKIILNKVSDANSDSTAFYFKDLSSSYETDSNQIFRDDVHTLQGAKQLIVDQIFNELNAKLNFK